MRAFRKQSFKEKFDFNLIYTTTDDAVRHILKVQKEEKSAVKIGSKVVIDADDLEIDDEPFPFAAYKAENDTHHNDEEFEPYIIRF